MVKDKKKFSKPSKKTSKAKASKNKMKVLSKDELKKFKGGKNIPTGFNGF